MMLRKYQAMKSLNYHGEQLRQSGSAKELPDPRSHFHLSAGKSSNFDPDIFAEVFSLVLDEALRRQAIKANKNSMDQSLAQKPEPRRRRMKI